VSNCHHTVPVPVTVTVNVIHMDGGMWACGPWAWSMKYKKTSVNVRHIVTPTVTTHFDYLLSARTCVAHSVRMKKDSVSVSVSHTHAQHKTCHSDTISRTLSLPLFTACWVTPHTTTNLHNKYFSIISRQGETWAVYPAEGNPRSCGNHLLV
jgi:hypothetical protein